MPTIVVVEKPIPAEYLRPDGGFTFNAHSNVQDEYDFCGILSDRILAVEKMGAIKHLFNFLSSFPVEGEMRIEVVVPNRTIQIAGSLRVWGPKAYHEFKQVSSAIEGLLEELAGSILETLTFTLEFGQSVTFENA